MAKDFVKLSEVTMLEEVTDNASVLVEMDGEIYRAPKTQVGGAGSVKTAIIRDSGYLNAIAGVSTMRGLPAYTYECINMTFEEAYETLESGEPLNVVGQIVGDGAMNVNGFACYIGADIGAPCILVILLSLSAPLELYWTADGLSTSAPSSGK